MTIFRPKPWVNTFEKMSIFQLFVLLDFNAQKGVFFVLEYRKRHFLGLQFLKNKSWKNGQFGPKPWVKPFAKMSISRLFELVVFIAQKGVFSLQNFLKDIFVTYISEKTKVGKMAIFVPKPWVNRFGKMSIFRFSNFLFLQPRKTSFRSRIS